MENRSLYEFSHFLLDPAQRILLREGERVHLHPKTFLILQTLIEANGEVVNKDDLMTKVWPDVVVEETNLTKNVSLLRKALGNGNESAEFIETIPKIGYRFRADIHRIGEQTGFANDAIAAANGRRSKAEELKTAEDSSHRPANKPVRPHWLWAGLAVAMVIGAGLTLWVMNADGSGQTRLTHLGGGVPAWSPDGKKIAFQSHKRTGNAEIYVMDVVSR
ncbi:MAG: winged helix-turn-helix domain-containing protein [Blastocatellia bacterium]